jgi:5-formaminoimidazole-4-carboxamide-1-beta-D-ribofuranosyl 5'-monophosphate synthetase
MYPTSYSQQTKKTKIQKLLAKGNEIVNPQDGFLKYVQVEEHNWLPFFSNAKHKHDHRVNHRNRQCTDET